MKSLIFFLTILVFVENQSCMTNQNLVKNFVTSLVSDTSLESIRKKYVYVTKENNTPEVSRSILLILEGLRGLIREQGGMEKIVIRRSDEMIPAEGKKIQTSGLDPEDIYWVMNEENELLFPVLLKNRRITAFSTLRKGEHRFFLEWN